MLLPLLPETKYQPVIMTLGGMGGSVVATNTTELIDMSEIAPMWVPGPAMSRPRVEMNAVLLPTGKILALGGSANDEDASTASFTADLYDPKTNSFSSAAPNVYPHLYHSTAVALTRCNCGPEWWQSPARRLRAAHRNLPAGIFVQPRWQLGDATLIDRRSQLPSDTGKRSRLHPTEQSPVQYLSAKAPRPMRLICRNA